MASDVVTKCIEANNVKGDTMLVYVPFPTKNQKYTGQQSNGESLDGIFNTCKERMDNVKYDPPIKWQNMVFYGISEDGEYRDISLNGLNTSPFIYYGVFNEEQIAWFANPKNHIGV